MKDKLIIALDVEDLKSAERLLKELKGIATVYKIGSQLFTAYGPAAIDLVHRYGGKVFLDLKFHDIPRTVATAACEAVKLGVFMFNVHCSGGLEMMKACADAVRLASKQYNKARPIVLGVTVLTSIDDNDLKDIGIARSTAEQVLFLGALAKKAGLDGVVASGHDTVALKSRIGDDFVVVCPGVRPPGAEAQDQKRVVTIDEAIIKKADYIVVGRPITQAVKPAEVARWITQQL